VLNIFLPDKHVGSIFDIDPAELKKQGIKGIITDLDNTLVAWDVKNATPEVIAWFKLMEEQGIKVTIISNNKQERVRIFSEPLSTPFVYSAKKPLRRAFRTVLKQMELKKEEVVVIGDQILTDVLGGNRFGFYTILVIPIVKSDSRMTKLNRKFERGIIRYFEHKGKLDKEE